MRRRLKRLVRRSLLGRTRLQPMYRFLFRAGLAGMNYGVADLEESGELSLLDRLAARWKDSPVIVFDVGANVGDYAAAVLERFDGVQLHCFEPSHDAFARLTARLARHPASPVLHSFGLGAREEKAPLFADAPGSGLASVYERRLAHVGIASVPLDRFVQLRRLDDVAQELGIDYLHLLKIDVEGHELAVLEGAGDMLGKQIEAIQFEFGGANIDSRTFFRDIWYALAPSYRIHRIAQDGLVELHEYRETIEQFWTANYLCTPRGSR